MLSVARGAGRAAPPDAVGAVVEAVRQLEGLTAQVGPFALPPDTCTHAPEVVGAVCRELGVPLTFDGHDGDHVAIALAAEIRRAEHGLAGADPSATAAAARRCADEEDAGHERHVVRTTDGAEVAAVAAGPRDAPCVLVSPPPGLSLRLSLPWLRALGSRYRCVVPQSRGTSGPLGDPGGFDRQDPDLADQVSDLLAVMDALSTGPVHVMGVCGGSGPALAATSRRPDRITSVSVWHPDLDLGGEAEQTDHQMNLRALVDLAGESRDTADWLRTKIVSGPMTGVPEGIGPLVVRPYATAELFYRYARLTAATVHWDCRPTARRLGVPCLVVTTEDDATTHPSGSRRLAEIAPRTELVVGRHGDHLDAFRAGAEQVGCLVSFLEDAVATPTS